MTKERSGADYASGVPSAQMPVSITRMAGRPPTGKFRLVAELGRGGMGNVYLALVSGPAGFNKLQVVKRLRPELAQDHDSVTMFLDEARLAARLSHPNVVQTNEVGEEDGHYFIAMEYLEGQSLDTLVRRSADTGGMPLAIHLRILSDALAGLHHAHELTDFDGTPLHLVHRDVTPQNVFVTYDGIAKLLDFGIAKAATSAHETRAGTFKGKCAYMAPEQIVGDAIDRRADIFSMGAVLWQAATGQRLWKGEGDMRIFTQVLSGEIPSPRKVNPNVSPMLEAVCMRALAQRREDRFQNALEMQSALEDVLEEIGGKATSRDVSRWVSERFVDERAKMRAAVDGQLRELARVSESQQVAPIAIFARGSEDGSSHSGRRQLEESPSTMSSLNAGVMFRAPSAAAPSDTPGRTGRKLMIGAVVALGIGIIAFRTLSTSNGGAARDAVQASAPVSAPVEPAAAPAAAAAREFTNVVISANPPSARIFVDDAPLSANPIESRFVRDGAVHLVRAEARGFRTRTQAIAFKGERLNVEISLEPEAPSSARPASAPPQRAAAPKAPAAAPRPPSDALPKPAAAAPRGIDTSDPWQ